MKIFRGVIGIICLFILILSFIFIALKIRNNFFDHNYRHFFTQSPFVRKILNLHDYGDAQSDYLGNKKFPKLLIEIDSLNGYELSKETLEGLKERLQEICQKPSGVEIKEDDTIYESQENFSVSEVRDLEKTFRDYYTESGQAVLYILVLTTSKEKPTSVGTTFSETGIVVFKKTIEDTSNLIEYQREMEESTIYHEFGHLLGLEHSKQGVMAEKVEVVNSKISESDFWFSEEDLAKIDNLKSKY